MLKYIVVALEMFRATICYAQTYEDNDYYLPETDYSIEQRAFNAPDHISANNREQAKCNPVVNCLHKTTE